MTRILVVILAIFLLNTCDLAQSAYVVPEQPVQEVVAPVYPHTPTPDPRFNGEFFSKYDGEGMVAIKFNGTHYVKITRYWTYYHPAIIIHDTRYLNFYDDGTLSVDMSNPEFGYTFYEFSFHKSVYSWNEDGSILTISGHQYGRYF